MFTTKPPRERMPDVPPEPIRITTGQILAAVWCVLLMLLIAYAFTLLHYKRQTFIQTMRNTNDVYNLLGEEAAKRYLERQTP